MSIPYDEIIKALKQSLKENSKDPNSWSNLGMIFASKGEHDKAIDAFKQSLKIEPKNAIVWNELGPCKNW